MITDLDTYGKVVEIAKDMGIGYTDDIMLICEVGSITTGVDLEEVMDYAVRDGEVDGHDSFKDAVESQIIMNLRFQAEDFTDFVDSL